MEREKQKKLEKERMEQQRSQLSKKEKKGNVERGTEDGPRLPQKSKFVSGYVASECIFLHWILISVYCYCRKLRFVFVWH